MLIIIDLNAEGNQCEWIKIMLLCKSSVTGPLPFQVCSHEPLSLLSKLMIELSYLGLIQSHFRDKSEEEETQAKGLEMKLHKKRKGWLQKIKAIREGVKSKGVRVGKPCFFKWQSFFTPAGRSQMSYYFIVMIRLLYFCRGINNHIQYNMGRFLSLRAGFGGGQLQTH